MEALEMESWKEWGEDDEIKKKDKWMTRVRENGDMESNKCLGTNMDVRKRDESWTRKKHERLEESRWWWLKGGGENEVRQIIWNMRLKKKTKQTKTAMPPQYPI